MFTEKQQRLLESFSKQSDMLFSRGIIRTDSFTGEIGEYIVCKHFKLSKTNRSTKAVDANDNKGRKYQIKAKVTAKNKLNYSIGNIDSNEIDFLAIIYFNAIYKPLRIIRIPSHQLPDNKFSMSNNLLKMIKHDIVLGNEIKIPECNLKEIITFGELYKSLLETKIVRSRKIVGDIGEFYACRHLNLILNKNKNEKGVDAIDKNGIKYEIKTRRVYESDRRKSNSRRLKNLENKSAEILVVVVLDKQFKCSGMWEMPIQNVVNPKSASLRIVNNTNGVKNIVKSKIGWLR